MADNKRRGRFGKGSEDAAQSIFDLFEPPPEQEASSFGRIPIIRDDEEESLDLTNVELVEAQAAAEAEAAGLQHWTEPATGEVPASLGDDRAAEVRGPSWRGEDQNWVGPDLSDVFAETEAITHERPPDKREFEQPIIAPGPATPSQRRTAPARRSPDASSLFDLDGSERSRPERASPPQASPPQVSPPTRGGPDRLAGRPSDDPRSQGRAPAPSVPSPAAGRPERKGSLDRPVGRDRSAAPPPSEGRPERKVSLDRPVSRGRGDDPAVLGSPSLPDPADLALPSTSRGAHDAAPRRQTEEHTATAPPAPLPENRSPRPAVPPPDRAPQSTRPPSRAPAPVESQRVDEGRRLLRPSEGPPPVEPDYDELEDHEEDAGLGRRFGERLIVGVAMAAVVFLALGLGPDVAMILIGVLTLLGVMELFNAMRVAGLRPATLLGLVGAVAVPAATYIRGDAGYPLVIGLAVVFGMLWYLTGADTERPVLNLGLTLTGILWVGGLAGFAALMLREEGGVGLLLATILITASSDTLAYLGGRAYGTKPFHPVSPNKTWEGTLTGFFGALFAGVVIGISDLIPIFENDFTSVLILAVVVGVLAPIGDLAESLVKRDLGIKDMGTLLPGHGGVLDRVDGLLFALPGAYYVAIVAQLI